MTRNVAPERSLGSGDAVAVLEGRSFVAGVGLLDVFGGPDLRWETLCRCLLSDSSPVLPIGGSWRARGHGVSLVFFRRSRIVTSCPKTLQMCTVRSPNEISWGRIPWRLVLPEGGFRLCAVQARVAGERLSLRGKQRCIRLFSSIDCELACAWD